MQISNYSLSRFLIRILILVCVSGTQIACAESEAARKTDNLPNCEKLGKGTSSVQCLDARIIETNANKYAVKSVDLKDVSTEGGLLEKYFENKNLVIAKVNYFGEMGKRIIKYYFKDNKQPIFAIDTIIEYDRPVYVTGREIDRMDSMQFVYDRELKQYELTTISGVSPNQQEKERRDFVNKVLKNTIFQ